MEAIVTAIRDFFVNIVGEELCVLFCSMIPIIELRGAIPMAALFGLPWWQAFLISVVGNLIPVPFKTATQEYATNLPARKPMSAKKSVLTLSSLMTAGNRVLQRIRDL